MSEREEHVSRWDQWARAYDDWFGQEDPDVPAAYLAKLAGGGDALELGVGTGRVAIPLARHGVTVTGIDHSPEMLARLESKAGALPVRPALRTMDNFQLDGQFQLVYVVLSTFYGLLTQEAQRRCFEEVAAVLAPDGVFVMECFNPLTSSLFGTKETFPRRNIALRSMSDEHVGLSVTMADFTKQTVRFQEIRITEQGVRLFPMHIRYSWPSELDLMARLAGLELSERYGGWDNSPFEGGRSFNHVSLYRRPGRERKPSSA